VHIRYLGWTLHTGLGCAGPRGYGIRRDVFHNNMSFIIRYLLATVVGKSVSWHGMRGPICDATPRCYAMSKCYTTLPHQMEDGSKLPTQDNHISHRIEGRNISHQLSSLVESVV
jgi:hypothetical protein